MEEKRGFGLSRRTVLGAALAGSAAILARPVFAADNKLIGIPVRHATQGLFYNEALLAEAGISAPPKTLEELVEQSKKLTFTSKAGTPVTGMILASDLAVFPVMFARAFGGDFITK